MAQKVRVILLDDLHNDDKTEADETVKFALDGKTYEIDLTTANANKLRKLLQPYTEAGRVVGRSTQRTARPTATATSSRSEDDTTVIRAWAVDKGLEEAGKRGRISNSIRQAYTAFQAGDPGPLNELRALKRALRPHEPVKQLDHSAAVAAATAADKKAAQKPALADPVTEFAEAMAENESTTDPDEAEAAKHYKPLTDLSPDARKKKWANRTAHGCQRTNKVADMTLMERIHAINNGGSDRNLTTLGMLAGVIPLKNGNVSFLSGSATRLEYLEMIRYAPDSDHGWEITDFGRYAHRYHTVGG